MKLWKKIAIGCGVLVSLSTIYGCMYISFGTPNSNSPFFITKEPMFAKQIALPIGTHISYSGSERYEQEKPLSEKAISSISFPSEIPIIWGEMPVESLAIYSDKYLATRPIWEANVTPKHLFFALWRECNGELYFLIKDNRNWQFAPNNLTLELDAKCGFNENFKAGSSKMKEMITEWQNLQKIAEK